ncbi:MAG: radical SAM protein [Candidatus Roizmanbacteria bacterium]|nr:radical SAM protein [Candidatus Roizmanbacteria bacterium]
MRNIEITTRIGCKNMCKFCPQTVFITQYRKTKGDIIMKFETYKKCIDKLPKDVQITFSGMSEPWLNKDMTKMLLYAEKKGFKEFRVYTTGVGMELKDIDKIKKIPFNKFVVHLPDGEKNAIIPVTKKHKELLLKIKKSKIKNCSYMTMGKLHSDLQKEFGNLVVSPKMISKAGNLEKFKRINNTGPIMCNSEFGLRHSMLLPNGDVQLCCMDNAIQYKIGNLLKEGYDSLYKGNAFKLIEKKLKDEKQGDVLCRHCEMAVVDNYKKYFRPIKRIVLEKLSYFSGRNDR